MIGSFLVENKTIIKVYGSTFVLTFILLFTMPNHDDDLSKSVSEESILQIKQYQGENLDIISLKKAIDKNLISPKYSFMCGDAFWVKADNYLYTYKDIYILEKNIKSCDPFHLNPEKTFCNHTKNDIKDKQRQALGE
jgi:hypothetical protein